MKDQILSNLGNAAQLEQLYQSDKSGFQRAFLDLYPTLGDSQRDLGQFWNERLKFTTQSSAIGDRRESGLLLIMCVLSGVIAILPSILPLDKEYFYSRNLGFIIFPALIAWFAWKNKPAPARLAFVAGALVLGLVFINLLPGDLTSDSLILSCIHLPLVLWCLLGFTFAGADQTNTDKRLGYLRYNGDLVVISVLIGIAGAIMLALTNALFSLIGIRLEGQFMQTLMLFILPTVPLLGTYFIRSNPELVGRISPLIARLFSPLVAAMLLIYLAAIAYLGKDPYNDREFLMLFNGLLIGVMAIIFFSVSESAHSKLDKAGTPAPGTWVLVALSVLTILVNCVALSAIIFRISEWGLTPNRTAVLGANILVLVNLVLVTGQLLRVIRRKTGLGAVGKSIASYLPVYFIWAIVVTFVFPLVFGF